MAAPLPLNKDFEVEAGRSYELTPRLRCVTCDNPSLFTFKGTNTYILGRGRVAIIDPGPESPAQTAAILAATKGETIEKIIITHTHGDHSPGTAALKAATGAETYAYAPHGEGAMQDWPFKSSEHGDVDFRPDHRVPDGGLIRGEGWTLEALYTPGHISNHLCFALKEDNALLSGDHVMGWSTSIVSPPDGDMAAYMASLDKLLPRKETVYYSGHGAPITDPLTLVNGFIAHRLEREDQILDCVEKGPMTIPAMVELMYTAVPRALHGAAARSVLSHIIRMVGDGRLAVDGPRVSPDGVYRLT
jgi:glyoxylase-like metal-dependent hydrolase (beta-lactamase superfamily II)